MFNEFIKEIAQKEIKVSFGNGRLKYSGPEKYIDEELVGKLKKFKVKLIKYFWPRDCPNMMPINPEGTKIPLILLHAGEANYPLSEYFGSDQPFYGFFYIGSEGEKIRYKDVESFAGEYLKQLKKIVPEGPYLLGGFSFGGILAYEMAIQLQKQGNNIPNLIIVDCEINTAVNNGKRSYDFHNISERLYEYAKYIYYFFYHNSRRIFYDLLYLMGVNLPANFRKSYIIWYYSKIMKFYRPNTLFSGAIQLFKTEENSSENKYLGWDRLCNHVELEILKGNHKTMYKDKESIEVLKEKIGDVLQKANVREVG